MQAIKNKCYSGVKILAEAPIDPTLKDLNGKTYKDYLNQHNKDNYIYLIEGRKNRLPATVSSKNKRSNIY